MTGASDRRNSDEKRREVAYHEAAHAVIGRRLAFPLLTASIIPNEMSNGQCDWRPPLSGVGGAMVCLAGPAAESIWRAEPGGDPINEAILTGLDMDKAGNLIRELTGPDEQLVNNARRLLEQVIRTTLTTVVVGKQWQDVADALFARRILSGGEVDELMAKAAG